MGKRLEIKFSLPILKFERVKSKLMKKKNSKIFFLTHFYFYYSTASRLESHGLSQLVRVIKFYSRQGWKNTFWRILVKFFLNWKIFFWWMPTLKWCKKCKLIKKIMSQKKKFGIWNLFFFFIGSILRIGK